MKNILAILSLTAAIFVWPLTSSAQPVTSVNVVGCIQLTITNDYAMVANQLDNHRGNLVVDLFNGVPHGTVVYKWNGTSYNTLVRLEPPQGNPRWVGDTNMTLVAGEGVFVKKPTTANQLRLTFVGDVLEGTLVNPLTVGYEIYSTMVPQEGGIQTVHGYQPVNGDMVYQYMPSVGAYRSAVWIQAFNGWRPTEPIIKVGEAFWLRTSIARDWVRDFIVE